MNRVSHSPPNSTPSPSAVNILAYGDGGLYELRNHLYDDEICYALLRITLGTGKLSKNKYIFVHWIGENVPFRLRAKALSQGDYVVKIQDFLGGSHLYLQASNLDDLSDQFVLNKLKSVIGIEKDIDYSLESILYQVNTTQHHQDSVPRMKENAKDSEQLCQKLEQWTVFNEPDPTALDPTALEVSSVEVETSMPKVC